jgi:uridine kinase
MSKSYIIGITGGSASGKTLFLKSLIKSFSPEEICVISQDDYYKSKSYQPLDLNGIENYDTPQSIDLDLFIRDLKALSEGRIVLKEEYTFNNPALQPKTLTFNPSPIILVEGIFIFSHPEIMNLLDLKIFIEAKEHIKIKRRISRDQAERGYGIDDVLYRYENHVSPTYEKHILPYKDYADLIIPNNEDFKIALEVLIGFLKAKPGFSPHKAF